MTTAVVYPNAPITEAVLDIRVTPRDGLDASELGAMTALLRDTYPQSEDQYELQGQVQLPAPTAAPNWASKKMGIVGRGSARTYQAQVQGVSVSKLKPYSKWSEFKAEAQRVWRIYKGVAKPLTIQRLATRYINRIDIPHQGRPIKLENYFQAYIEMSDDLDQPMSNFFFQVHIPQKDFDGLCVLNVGGLPPSAAGVASILLDIDIFKLGAVPQTDEEMWSFFDILRERKNRIFESCITDRCRELFR